MIPVHAFLYRAWFGLPSPQFRFLLRIEGFSFSKIVFGLLFIVFAAVLISAQRTTKSVLLLRPSRRYYCLWRANKTPELFSPGVLSYLFFGINGFANSFRNSSIIYALLLNSLIVSIALNRRKVPSSQYILTSLSNSSTFSCIQSLRTIISPKPSLPFRQHYNRQKSFLLFNIYHRCSCLL